MGMARDLADSLPENDPELEQWGAERTSAQLQKLLDSGIPRDVAEYILSQPAFAEGDRPHSTRQWEPPTPYRGWDDYDPAGTDEVGTAWERMLLDKLKQQPRSGQNISYQPGGDSMGPWTAQPGGIPGITAQPPQQPVGQSGTFGGSGNVPQWMQNMTPQQLQAFWQLMQSRGSRGAQANASPVGQAMANMAPMRGPGGGPAMGGAAAGANNAANALMGGGGGIMGQLAQNPDLLRYIMAQGQPGQMPQQGGGVNLAQIFQALGIGQS